MTSLKWTKQTKWDKIKEEEEEEEEGKTISCDPIFFVYGYSQEWRGRGKF